MTYETEYKKTMNSKHITADTILVYSPQLSDVRYQRTADEHMRRPVNVKVRIQSDLPLSFIQKAEADIVQDDSTGKQKLLVSIGKDNAEVLLPYDVIESSVKACCSKNVLTFTFDVVKGGELEHTEDSPFQSVTKFDPNESGVRTNCDDESTQEESDSEFSNNEQEPTRILDQPQIDGRNNGDDNKPYEGGTKSPSYIVQDKVDGDEQITKVAEDKVQPTHSVDNSPRIIKTEQNTYMVMGVEISTPFPFAFHI